MNAELHPIPTCNSDELEATEMELALCAARLGVVYTLAKAMGREVPIEIENRIRADKCLVASLSNTGEAQTSFAVSYLLGVGSPEITQHLVGGKVSSFSREVRLRCGVADFVVEHPNDSRTVIELKRSSSRKDQIGGIGQVLMYTADLRSLGLVVHPLLLIVGEVDPYTKAACALAGVPCAGIDNEAMKSYLRIGQRLKEAHGQA